MLRPSRIYRPPQARRRRVTPFDSTALLGGDARDLNGNGDGNAGWSNGDVPLAAKPWVPNVGTMSPRGVLQQSVATGWTFQSDAGDGLPALTNTTTATTARLLTTLAAAAFTQWLVDGQPFSWHIVMRSTVGPTDHDGVFAATGAADIFGAGFYLAYPVGGGFPFGLAAERLPDPAGSNFVLDSTPPENLFFLASFEHPGQIPGALMELSVNGVLVDTHPVEATYSPPANAGALALGYDGASATAALGSIRWWRAFPAIGWTAEVNAYCVANNLY